MRKTFASILALCALAAATMTSCKKDDTLIYGNVNMGNIDGESIISDNGNTFDIVEAPFAIDLSTFEYGRVILSCDVLKHTGDARYDIRLTAISSVLTKPAVKKSTITDPESELAVEDAIVIKEMWYGGGYLNMLIEFAQKKGSQTKHFINLVHDDTVEGEGYTFILRHNAYGEFPDKDKNESYSSSLCYVSFPIAGMIEGDQADLTIKWKSHKLLDNGMYSPYEHEDMTEECKWKRTGYEHKNTTLKSKTTVYVR